MSKKIIRLTESELKQLINESVKQVISELDWKTYMNASKKTKGDKSHDLQKYAERQFDKQHGQRKIVPSYRNDGSNSLETIGLNSFGGVSKSRGDSDVYHQIDNNGNEVRKKLGSNGQIETLYTDKGYNDEKLKSAHDEYNNYYNGNYDYISGKGYSLKK